MKRVLFCWKRCTLQHTFLNIWILVKYHSQCDHYPHPETLTRWSITSSCYWQCGTYHYFMTEALLWSIHSHMLLTLSTIFIPWLRLSPPHVIDNGRTALIPSLRPSLQDNEYLNVTDTVISTLIKWLRLSTQTRWGIPPKGYRQCDQYPHPMTEALVPD